MENFTDSISKLKPEASSFPSHWAALNAALNALLSITATMGNTLILISLHKVSSIHPPTKLLFRCLAFTDLCVGLTVQPIYVFINLNYGAKLNLNVLPYVIKVERVLAFALCGVSTATSTTLCVDRLLALNLGLRYRLVVTLRRVRSLIICFWLTSISGAFMYAIWSYTATMSIATVLMILSVLISLFSCATIFVKLRQHQAQVHQDVHHEQPNGGEIPLNLARYKKTVYSIVCVQLALAACYVPYIILVVTVELDGCCGIGGVIGLNYAVTLYLLNSSLNPILYCWKIKEVRRAVKDTVKRVCFPSD